MYAIEITGAADESAIVSTADLKAFLRVDHTDDDAVISALRSAAVQYCENFCNIRLGDVAAVLYLDNLPTHVEFPIGPVTAVSSVTYYDSANVQQTLSASSWYADTKGKPARISFINPPSVYSNRHNGTAITFTAGYAEADVPGAIVHAIKFLVGHFYENRQSVIIGTIASAVPMSVQSLLNPYRIISDR